MLEKLKQLIGGVQSQANAVTRLPLLKDLIGAANSINPLYPQPAEAPEDLRPGQRPSVHTLPYGVSGKPAYPEWGIRTPPQVPTAPMPEVLGLPDYTVHQPPEIRGAFEGIELRPDQPIPDLYGELGTRSTRGFAPRAVRIPTEYQPAKLPRYQI